MHSQSDFGYSTGPSVCIACGSSELSCCDGKLPMSEAVPIEDDDFYEDEDEDDFCDCDDFDADLLEGRAHCFRCGRSWWMSGDEILQEIRWQASMIEDAEENEKTA